MAFHVQWPRFSVAFVDYAKNVLTEALNAGEKPSNILGLISVTDLHMGSIPPELEVLEIGEIGQDRLRGMFKLTYSGNAYIVLQTKVQVNPLTQAEPLSIAAHSQYVAASAPLVVPLQLSISNVQLRGLASLAVDKNKGITLAFKNDPLERVDVNSTFDHMTTIRNFLQEEIEKQLRILFQETIPALVHAASLNLSTDQSTPPPPPLSITRPKRIQSTLRYNDGSDTDEEPLSSPPPENSRWLGNEIDETIIGPTKDTLKRISMAIRTRGTILNESNGPFSIFQRQSQPQIKRCGLLKVLEMSSDEESLPIHTPLPPFASSQSTPHKEITSSLQRRSFVNRFNNRYYKSQQAQNASYAGSESGEIGLLKRSNLSTTSLPSLLNNNLSNKPIKPSTISSQRSTTLPSSGLGNLTPPALRSTISLSAVPQHRPESDVDNRRNRHRRTQGNDSRHGSGTLDSAAVITQDSFTAAQLSNMFNANQSLSPFSRTHEHSTFRSSVPVASNHHKSASLLAAAAAAASTNNQRQPITHPSHSKSANHINNSTNYVPLNRAKSPLQEVDNTSSHLTSMMSDLTITEERDQWSEDSTLTSNAHLGHTIGALSSTIYNISSLDSLFSLPSTAQRPQRPIGYFVYNDGDHAHYHIVHYNRLGKRGKRAVCKRVFWVDLSYNQEKEQNDDGINTDSGSRTNDNTLDTDNEDDNVTDLFTIRDDSSSTSVDEDEFNESDHSSSVHFTVGTSGSERNMRRYQW